MANFAACVWDDPERKSTFLKAASAKIAPYPEMDIQRRETGDFAVIWATAHSAPVSWIETENWAALLLGEARQAGRDRLEDAAGVADAWLGARGVMPGWDGFHAMLVYDKIRSVLRMGSDCLGTFPAYYLDSNRSIAVASTPELLSMHPGADLGLDPKGLLGILHSCGLQGEATICRGIRRLAARKIYSGTPGRFPVGLEQEPIPWDPDLAKEWATLGRDAHAQFLGEAADKTARRHFPSQRPVGLLLSGGLDSRMMAGLARECGLRPTTVTFGENYEIESQIAAMVSDHLGWKRLQMPEPLAGYAQLGKEIALREHLSAGFAYSFGPMVSQPSLLSGGGKRMLTGLQLDFAASGLYLVGGRKDCFNLGFLPGPMRELLLPQFMDAYEEMVCQAQAEFAGNPGDDYQKTMLRDLEHGGRFHVGVNLWRLAFGSWPVPITLDRAFLGTCLSIPEASTRDRWAQKMLVAKRFPDLARFPLDHNADDWYYLGEHSRWSLPELRLKVARKINLIRGRELRYYQRTYGLDSPHWNELRRMAEPGRDQLSSLFHREVLDRILPPPGTMVPLDPADRIVSAAPLKVLLGAMILAQELPIFD